MAFVGSNLILLLLGLQVSQSKRVLVVINENSPDSLAVGAYYVKKRSIPHDNVVFVKVTASNNVSMADYTKSIEGAVRANLTKNKNKIDFILLAKGVPIRLDNDGGYSVDGYLATMDLKVSPIRGDLPNVPDSEQSNEIRRAMNPYFNKREPFSHDKFKMYLVTRLDGYSAADAKALVDRSLSAKREQGPFFFDMAGNRSDGDYGAMNQTLKLAADALEFRDFKVILDTATAFVAPTDAVAGYASWGSNDGAYKREIYNRVKFKPGALCETFVSTSAFTFSKREHWQSLIADLIEQGVTGVKGYVSEPYTFALARPQILFERYVSGFNLAESFYMASPVIKWKDVVIGDPLCNPYKK
ncbi:MAG TPA: TIGR03790 family protein [Fimbriimonadaceae bacterium]|nr:TIGR03790 family protein [Fimbriimonadaceae bacterium]